MLQKIHQILARVKEKKWLKDVFVKIFIFLIFFVKVFILKKVAKFKYVPGVILRNAFKEMHHLTQFSVVLCLKLQCPSPAF